MEKELPERKHPRLKNHDYSTSGLYFITICTQEMRCVLSEAVGRGLAPAAIHLKPYGKVAEEELLSLEKRFQCVSIKSYVIMPNHIHFIMLLNNETAGARPRPTVMDVICAYKSLTTRRCKTLHPIDKLFQTSFYEHIIHNREDYKETLKYIYNNPSNWYFDKMYSPQ